MTFDGLDLLLMHRFTTVTCLILNPNEPAASHIWQNVIPAEAYSHPLLWHGILAMAALDVAQDNGNANAAACQTRALHHQQTGLSMFQVCMTRIPSDEVAY